MIFTSIYNKQDETTLQYNLSSFKTVQKIGTKTSIIKIQKKRV